MKKIFLNFDFYGSGNIGDDLMLDGFLNGLTSKLNLYCCIPRESSHMKLRFPRIKFLKSQDRYKIAGLCNIWIGVGDTPIQVRSGEWFLSKLLADERFLDGKKVRYYFLGVGAEIDSTMYRKKFMKALAPVKQFWTRDATAYDILIEEFKISSDRVSISSDLANISLKKIFEDSVTPRNRKFDVGMCYYDEYMTEEDFTEIKKFILSLKVHKKSCLLFGNEVKTEGNFEYKLYSRMFNKLDLLLKRNIRIFKPDYYNADNTSELVSHYSDCEYVISSRYHSLLTAAWAGCKPISIERSSKNSGLANELGIPEIKKPFTEKKFYTAIKQAKRIEESKLELLYDRSINSVKEFEKEIKKINSEV